MKTLSSVIERFTGQGLTAHVGVSALLEDVPIRRTVRPGTAGSGLQAACLIAEGRTASDSGCVFARWRFNER